ncbi:hypothetical protein D3C71_1887970 [compost metagenome]
MDSRWAITKLVLPFIKVRMADWMCISVRVSMLLVASSRIRMAGSARMARAMVRSWRCPWLRLLPSAASTVLYPLGSLRMKLSALASLAAAMTSSSVASSLP